MISPFVDKLLGLPETIGRGLSRSLLYDPEKNRILPGSPYWQHQEMIQSPAYQEYLQTGQITPEVIQLQQALAERFSAMTGGIKTTTATAVTPMTKQIPKFPEPLALEARDQIKLRPGEKLVEGESVVAAHDAVLSIHSNITKLQNLLSMGGERAIGFIRKNYPLAKEQTDKQLIDGLKRQIIKDQGVLANWKQARPELFQDFYAQAVKGVEKPIVKGVIPEARKYKSAESLFHSTDKTIKNVVKAGEYSPQNYFGEGVYLGSKEGIYPGKNTYRIAVPEELRTLDLTKGNNADSFLQKVSKEIGIPVEKTGMGVYEDLRIMAFKSSDIKVRNVVNKLTKGYEAIKSPLEYEGTYELVVRKPQLFTTDFYTQAVKGVRGAASAFLGLIGLDKYKQQRQPERRQI